MAIINGTDGNDLFRITDNPAGGDEFFLGAGNDFVFANIGADSYFGGDGIDTVSYRFATSGVTLNLVTGGTGGIAAGHVYDSIERIFGSNFDDIITGSGNSDFLYGGLGEDTLNGAGGDDRLFGQDGDDTLLGGAGNDYLEGGEGADFIDGGSGIDTIGFSTASEGVTVSLSTAMPVPDETPQQRIPQDENPALQAQGDVYINIENISGSSFNDILEGNDGANVINGRAGDDVIDGGLGNDRLIGGFGNDTLNGGDGNDNLQGGTGDDTIFGGAGNDLIFLGEGEDFAEGGEGNDFFFLTNDGNSDEIYGGSIFDEDGLVTDDGFDTVSYIQATEGVEIFLGGLLIIDAGPLTSTLSMELFNGTLNTTVQENDFLIGIERVIGSNFNDVIFGGFEDETLIGGNGDDILDGGGGRDRLIGGNGADEFGFFIGGSDTDAILDFEQGTDTITFFTFDEGLTAEDILATLVDFGTHFVFEFGLVDEGSPLEQRLSVIKNDPDFTLTADDFTIQLLDPAPPLLTQEYFMDGIFDQSLTEQDMLSAEFDALI